MKSLEGTKTEANLWAAFAGESQARNKYNYFASAARKEGYEQIAAVFEETAGNEKEHAKRLLKFLGGIGDTVANLDHAAGGEHHEWAEMYPAFERVAREEGFPEIADVFKAIAAAEVDHEARYRKLRENLTGGKVFGRETTTKWHCRNCGYIHEGREAPDVCPACAHPRAFFELKCDCF